MSRSLFAPAVLTATLLLAGCDSTTAEEHLDRAQQEVAEGSPRAAVIELKNALQKQPDFPAARLLLGQAHERLGDYPSALKEYGRALDQGLDSEEVRLGLARTKVRLGRHQEVIGELEGQQPLAPEFALVLAEAYLANGDIAHAKPLFEQSLSLAGGNLGLGMIAWRQGDLERAASYLARATELDPQHADAWLQRAEFELSRDNHAGAADAYASAAELPTGRVLGTAGLARVELARQDLDAAAEHVEQLVKMAPDLPLAQYLNGLVLYQRQDLDGAEAAIRQVQGVAPDHRPSLYLMGVIKYRQGQLGQAEDNLQRYLAGDAGNASAIKLLASVRFDREAYAEVASLLEPLLTRTEDPQVLAMYGTAQMRLGNAAEATEALERAVALAPDMAPFRNQLALSLLSQGDQAQAEAQLASAIEVDGEQFQSDYLMAMLRLRDRDWAGARNVIDDLIEKSPDSPIGYNLLGAVELGEDDPDAARSAFETALQKAPEFFPAVQNLARLAARTDAAAADRVYAEFLADNPGHENALLARAQLALERRDVDAAIELLEDAAASNPTSVRSHVGLARLYLAQNRLEDADASVTRGLSVDPELSDLLLLRAEVDLRNGNEDRARLAASQLQSRLPAQPDNVPLHLAVASLQMRVGDLTLARSNLQKLLQLTEGGDPASANRIAALTLLARLDLREQQPRAARERVAALQALDQTGPDLDLLHADVLVAEGKPAQAVPVYQRLADSGNREAVLRLASMQLSDGDIDAAANRLAAWLEEHPEDKGMELVLADALLGHDPERALGHYERLVETGNPVVLNNLAWLYMERGDDRAVAMARRAAAAAPANPEILDTLGWILVQQGETREAVRSLKRSVELRPDNPTIRYHLAVALRDIGDTGAARRALEEALRSDGFAEAEQARQLLDELTSADAGA